MIKFRFDDAGGQTTERSASISAATREMGRRTSPMQYQRRIESMLEDGGQLAVFSTLCKSIITSRTQLAGLFGSLCSDPGGEMLLDLYWRDSQDLKTSLTSLWRASKASEMTARHCLAEMEAQAIVERLPDPLDKRRTYVRLTSSGREKMDACFRTLLTGFAQAFQDCTIPCTDTTRPQDHCPWSGSSFAASSAAARHRSRSSGQRTTSNHANRRV